MLPPLPESKDFANVWGKNDTARERFFANKRAKLDRLKSLLSGGRGERHTSVTPDGNAIFTFFIMFFTEK